MNATKSRNVAVLARGPGALLLVVTYSCVYFPFASGISRRVLERTSVLDLSVVLALMGAGLFACRIWRKPSKLSGRVALWLCFASWIASLIGMIFLSLPQHGHPSIGIIFFIVPVGLNLFLIPVALGVIAVALIRGERISFVLGGLLFLLAASFFFSSLRFALPPALDFGTGTNWFTKIARRVDVDFTDDELPNCDEMIKDTALIKKGKLSRRKLYHLEIAAERASHLRRVIFEELVLEFPTVEDFGLQREVLMKIDLQQQRLRAEERSVSDVIFFYHNVMGQRNGDVSDIAAHYLTMWFFERILSEDRYQNTANAIAEFALERQQNPQSCNWPTGRFYMQRSFDCVGPLSSVASNLLNHASVNAVDRKVITNLLLFLPYLEARKNDSGEPYREHKQWVCADCISKITRLQSR